MTPQEVKNIIQANVDAVANSGATPLTLLELQQLVDNVEWEVPAGKTIIFYSGPVSILVDGQQLAAWQVVNAIAARAPDKFFIDVDSGPGSILNSSGSFYQDTFRRALSNIGINSQAAINAATDPSWAALSRKMAQDASGAVLTITPNANDPTKVFNDVEIVELIKNPKVTTINGLAREGLELEFERISKVNDGTPQGAAAAAAAARAQVTDIVNDMSAKFLGAGVEVGSFTDPRTMPIRVDGEVLQRFGIDSETIDASGGAPLQSQSKLLDLPADGPDRATELARRARTMDYLAREERRLGAGAKLANSADGVVNALGKGLDFISWGMTVNELAKAADAAERGDTAAAHRILTGALIDNVGLLEVIGNYAALATGHAEIDPADNLSEFWQRLSSDSPGKKWMQDSVAKILKDDAGKQFLVYTDGALERVAVEMKPFNGAGESIELGRKFLGPSGTLDELVVNADRSRLATPVDEDDVARTGFNPSENPASPGWAKVTRSKANQNQFNVYTGWKYETSLPAAQGQDQGAPVYTPRAKVQIDVSNNTVSVVDTITGDSVALTGEDKNFWLDRAKTWDPNTPLSLESKDEIASRARRDALRIDPGKFGALGGSLLSTLTSFLDIDDPLARVATSAVLRTIGNGVAQVLNASINKELSAQVVADIVAVSADQFGDNLADAGIGAVSSYLTGQLVASIGLTGTAAEVTNTVASQVITQIASNLLSSTKPGWNAGLDATFFATIALNYAGSKIADAIWTPSDFTGQVGAALGTAYGSWMAARIVALNPANPINWAVALIVLITSRIHGGLIGSLFGGPPKSEASMTWTVDGFEVGEVWKKNHGSAEAARNIAEGAAAAMNFAYRASGGVVLQPDALNAGRYGLYKTNFRYRNATGKGENYIFSSKNANEVIDFGVREGVASMLPVLGGGDIYVKRALNYLVQNKRTTFDSHDLTGVITNAYDYERYKANYAEINAAIGDASDTALAATWITVIAAAGEIGLNRRSATDFVGGWNLLFDEMADGKVDGRAAIASNILQFFDFDTKSRGLFIIDDPTMGSSVLSDTVLGSDKSTVTGSLGADVLTISGDTVTATAGFTINGAAPETAAYKIPVAAMIDVKDGDDIVRAGDLGNDVFAGAGNDRIVGGKLDDWLFGGDGDDTLFAGDAVSAGVVTQAALQANGALVVNAAAAVAVDGGNGDLLDGGAGNDRLYGGKGSEWLRGGDGVDALYGGAGGDILEGGAGDDQGAGAAAGVLGGAGSDQYVFGYGDGNDVIFDESDPAGAAGSTGDSLYTRMSQISAGTLARDWAGGGAYEVDGSVKGGEDAIVFGVGITMQNLIMKRSGTTAAPGQDLIIQLTVEDPAGTLVNGHVRQIATGDSLIIKDWFESTRKVEWLRFANGDDIRIGDITSYVIGVAGSSVILGTNGADWIVGTDGADKIYGLNGDDFGFGGLGNDLVSGDANNDLVSGGAGDDVVIGGAGNDTVLGDGGNDRAMGGLGNDILAGGKGDDVIIAGAGNDVVRYARGDGQEVVIDDLVDNWDLVWQNGAYVNGYVLNADGTVTKGGNIVTGVGAVYFDGSKWIDGFNYDYDDATKTLRRHKGAVDGVISANVGTDTLEFTVGVDLQDLMLRRVGNDLEVVVAEENTTSGFAGASDKITIKDWWSASTGAELRPIEKFTFAATGSAAMTGYAVAGGVTDGADDLTGGVGHDWITGGGGDDILSGADGNDILQGGQGDDTLKGGGGGDVLYGGAGSDLLDGGSSGDKMFGGAGADMASYASNGTTGVRAYLGQSNANGGSAIGDIYVDIEGLEGSRGADRLAGDGAENLMRGGVGADKLWGGAGDDTYEFSRGDGSDSIYEGAVVIEEILDSAGNLNSAFGATWQLMRVGAATGVTGAYHQYQLVVRRLADSEVVYRSRDGVDFLYAAAQATMPGGSAWPYANSQWTTGAGRASGVQTVLEHVVAGDGGEDTLALGSTISLSDLTMSRGANYLRLTVDASNIVTLYGQSVAERAVETLQLADGLSVHLTQLRLGAEAATADDDFMLGGGGDDIQNGLAGDDVLSGGLGNDSLSGGAGNDYLEGGAGADTLDGGADSQTDGQAVTAGNAASHGDTIRYVSSAAAVVIDLAAKSASGGDAQDDIIVASAGVSTIENVVGSDGHGDQLSGDSRANRLFGLGGNDLLDGGAGDDVLVGGAGEDTLYGGDGDDALAGEDGVDRLEGGGGKDLLSGGAGNDTLLGQAGDDQLTGDDGDDALYGGDGLDTLGGGAGADILHGEVGDDKLVGGEGADQLFGGDGDDILVGEAGDDLLDGGAGGDTYGFDANSGVDRIVDASGVNRIVITGVTSDRVWLTRSGDDLKVAVIGGASVITVAGYYAATGASLVKEIALDGASLFLGHAQALIDAMTAASPAAPTAMPTAIATQAAPFWHAGGKAAPIVADQALSTNEDVVLQGQVGAIDDDDNIAGYALAAAPTLGVLQLNAATGAWTYTPTANTHGDERFVLSVTDADGHVVQQTVALTVISVNDAPDTLTGPAALTIDENAANGVFLGQFASTDPDGPTEAATYWLSNDAEGRFELTATGELKIKNGAALNYEAATSHVVRARVTDAYGAWLEKDFTVTVGNVNEAPHVPVKASQPITLASENASGAGPALAGRTIATFTLIDPDNTTPSLRIASDPKGWLQIVGNAVQFKTGLALNFEALAAGATLVDTDADGVKEFVYSFQVETWDGALASTSQTTLSVNIEDANEKPTNIAFAPSVSSVAERDRPVSGAASPAISLGTLSATDPDTTAGSSFATFSYSVADSRFEIVNGNELRLKAGAALDYEAGATVSLSITVKDLGGAAGALSFTKAFNLTVTNQDDYLYGDANANTLIGQANRDLLYGYGGADVLSGGTGNDSLYGGDGNDTLYGEAGVDVLDGGLGDDILDGGQGADTLSGGDGVDILAGGSEADTLYGESGNDVLHAGSENDLLDGGDGNDQLSGDAGDDRLVGGAGDDDLIGGSGADRFLGGAGVDTVNYSYAGAGVTVNLVSGGTGGDAAGDIFEDVLERLVGSSFNDNLTGTAAADIIQGGAGNDTLTGNEGVDNLDGGAGDDILIGGVGDDILIGGAGSDTMYGGAGDDVYLIDINSGADFIDAFDNTGGKDSIGYQPDANGQNAILNSQLWFERPAGTTNLVISDIGTGVSTTVLKWYDPTTGGNQKIDFIIAGDKYTVDAEGLVTLMAAQTKPTTAAAYAAMHADTSSAFENQWRNFWYHNGAPTISTIAEQTIAEDGSPSLQFIVSDDITPYANLTVTAKAVNASNTTLDDTSLINAPIVSAPDASGNRTLTFTAKPNASGRTAVKVTAVDPGGITSKEMVFYVNIDPRADTPLVTQARPLAGTLDSGTLALDIQAALTDQDGSETLEIRISNIPTGLTLNKGTNLGGGVWSLTPAQLSGLALVGPATWSADLTGASALNVTAISREQANGSTASYGPADNQIANSRFLNGQANWQMATNKAAGTTGWGANLSIDWTGSGNDVLFSTMLGAQAAGGLVDIRSEMLATKAGATYETSVLAAQHRGNAELWIEYYAADNSLISAIKLSGSARESGARFGDPANFNQLGGVTTAPVGAVGRRVNLRLASTTGSDPYAFFMRPISRPTAQSTLGDWSQLYPQVLNVPINARPTAIAADRTITVNETTAENQVANGTLLAKFSRADADNDTPTYSLIDIGGGAGAGGRFAINAATGDLVLANTSLLNFEAAAAYTIRVRVTDTGGLTFEKDFTVNVANLNERPTVPGPSQSAWIFSEGVSTDALIASYSASDPDGGAPGFYETFDAWDWLYMSGAQLRRRANVNIDFEWLKSLGTDTWRQITDIDGDGRQEVALAVDVASSDGTLSSASNRIWYYIEDVNDAPTDLWADRTLSAAENAANGTVVGVFFRADQDAADGASYSLVNNTSPFALSGSTLVVAGALNYEAVTSYNLTVRVTDPYGAYYDEVFSVAVANVNEAPTDLKANSTLSFDETIGPETPLALFTAQDPEGGSLKYSLTPDKNGSRFTVSETGLLMVGAAALDFENGGGSTKLWVRVSDGVSLPLDREFEIVVNDLNEAPSIFGWNDGATSKSVSELAGPGTNIGTVSFGDPDTAGSSNAALLLSLSGLGSEKFRISSSGVISYHTGNIDYETQSHEYNLIVTATDRSGSGISTSKGVRISVAQIDEGPVIGFDPTYRTLYGSDPEGSGVKFVAKEVTTYVDQYATLSFNNTTTISSYSLYSNYNPSAITGNYINLQPRIDYYYGGTWLGQDEVIYNDYYSYDLTVVGADSGGVEGHPIRLHLGFDYVGMAPIVLDLNGDGVQLNALFRSNVQFDMDQDGALNRTGWVSAQDGLLVLDRNHNGRIDSGTEISFLNDEADAHSDLEGLRTYDSNANGFFDGQDDAFFEFQVWRDANQNGVSDSGELFSLADLGIDAISLTLNIQEGEPSSAMDNRIYGTTQFVRTDGTFGEVGDVTLVYQSAPIVTVIPIEPAGQATALLPPVVIDLDGDGVELVDRATSTVRFDVAGDGQPIRTGWVGADDAFLALDRDGDGQVTNGGEISFVGDLEGAVSDLEGLRAFDTNENGFLDGGDARFGEFRVWQDKNQDGVSQASELHGLAAMDFQALNLSQRMTGARAEVTGQNVLYATSDLLKTDGARLTLGDVMLAFDAGSQATTTDDETPLTTPRGSQFDAKPWLAHDWDLDTLIEGGLQNDGEGLTSSDELAGVDRTAASTLKPPAQQTRLSADRASAGSGSRPADGRSDNQSSDAPAYEPLSPRSRSEIDLSGILDAAYRTSAGVTPVDYGDLTNAGERSALDAGLALAQQTRLQMIQAMAGFSREGAADFGPDALRRGHAQSLALLTALPDIRVR